MPKQAKNSLGESIRPSLLQMLLVIGLVAAVSISIGVIIAFAPENTSPNLIWVLIVFLMIFAVVGTIGSLALILRYSRSLAVGKENRALEWRSSPREKQKSKLNREVMEIASFLNIPREQLSDLFSAYIVAEDLAMRKIQIDAERPLIRNVNVGNIPFDAIWIDRNTITCIETTLAVSSEIDQTKIDKVLNKIQLARKTAKKLHPQTKLKLHYVIVTQLDAEGEAKVRSTIVDKFSATPTDVDIRLLDFEQLQKTFEIS